MNRRTASEAVPDLPSSPDVERRRRAVLKINLELHMVQLDPMASAKREPISAVWDPSPSGRPEVRAPG